MSKVIVDVIEVSELPTKDAKPLIAKLTCNACGYSHAFFAGGAKLTEPYSRYSCGKCSGRVLTYHVYELVQRRPKRRAAPLPVRHPTEPEGSRSAPVSLRPWRDQSTPVRAKKKFCAECSEPIADHTLMARPDTRYCSKHLTMNHAILPSQDTFGSREDFKKDSGSNWSNARKPKF